MGKWPKMRSSGCKVLTDFQRTTSKGISYRGIHYSAQLFSAGDLSALVER
ncbi:MAG: hypothetical protein ACFFC7_30615 [Candidatus Hermodarchaeota archaeon]